MKKYFLKNQKYTKFTLRMFTTISIIAFITGFIIMGWYIDDSIGGGLVFGVFCAASVWGIYAVIRWILKALPDS